MPDEDKMTRRRIFDDHEYQRHLMTVDEQLDDAATLAAHGSYNSAVLHVEQATQILFKGLLRGAGLSELTFIHSLRTLAERCVEQLGMVIAPEELGDLKRLERDYQPTRYPDALVEGTPRGAYDEADFERSTSTFEAARQRVAETWDALNAAAAREPDELPPLFEGSS